MRYILSNSERSSHLSKVPQPDVIEPESPELAHDRRLPGFWLVTALV